MKTYPLSTPSERTTGIIFSAIMTVVLGFLLFILKEDLLVMLLTAAGIAVVVGILVLYIMNVAKAACVYDPQTHTLKVMGFQERTIDLTKVTYLQTITVKSGHVEGRSLAFSNSNDEMVAIVPTYFTSNRGVLAEPMAKEMAADLGLEFIANVPAWEYDEEARKAHEIEVAQQEKEEARKRKEGKKALLQAKIRKKMEESRNDKK